MRRTSALYPRFLPTFRRAVAVPPTCSRRASTPRPSLRAETLRSHVTAPKAGRDRPERSDLLALPFVSCFAPESLP